ncbi:hypothetical protein [Tropicimonas sediminicola]|nr:hypothetical protein [Tropicimonas sediminicola]
MALVKVCNAFCGPNDPRCLVMLVGGAGNGKSKLAADTVAQIDGTLQGERSKFAKRKYCFQLKTGGDLKVINDATIPAEDRCTAPLLRDLAEAISRQDHLLACVNRGVLISEASTEVTDKDMDELLLAKCLANWLLTGEPTELSGNEFQLELAGDARKGSGNYGFAKVRKAGSHIASIHAVYMDQASLLEAWPEGDERMNEPLEPLEVRGSRLIPLLSSERATTSCAFEECLRKVAHAFAADAEVRALDPVLSNAFSLQAEFPARGWCSMMRGAEVISGSQFTYRELWALATHSLVGPSTPGVLDGMSAEIDTWIGAADSDGDGSLEALVALGNMRTHMLLFDAGNPGVASSPTRFRHSWPSTSNEALRSVSLADPLRQFGPSDGKKYLELADRLSRIEDKELPITSLALEEVAVGQYFTELDGRIEAKIAEAVNPENDRSSLKVRNSLLDWYGRYMYRLVAFARGWPAHCSVVHAWQDAWIDARVGRPFRRELEDAILDIVAPVERTNSEAYFTFLKPRVAGNSTDQSVAEIEIPRNRMRVSAEAFGDRIEIMIDPGDIRDGKNRQASTPLDFHLLREAQSRVRGQGFTDSLELIEPRIERLRASLVAKGLAAQEGQHRFRFSKVGMGSVTR